MYDTKSGIIIGDALMQIVVSKIKVIKKGLKK
jgi:hypothetical protein